MALIKCPECNKDVSDKAKSCIHCGCPLNTDIANTDSSEVPIIVQAEHPVSITKNNKKMFLVVGAVVFTALASVVALIIYNITVTKPLKIYNEAVQMLSVGKYEDANILFDTITDYKDVKTLQEQLKYESRVYECITSVKEVLKNPDSLQIYEVQFYESKDTSTDKSASNSESKDTSPTCVMRFGGQNGFGGNTTSYGLFAYSNEEKKYTYFGSCDTLDKDEIDEDDFMDLITCTAINVLQDNNTKIGSVDINRIKKILKDDSYSTIKIIE